MSEEHVSEARRGRVRRPAKTERGRAILAALDEKGLTLHQAAKKARITFQQVYRVIHEDPDRLSVKTVAAVCTRLDLPLSLVAPRLAPLAHHAASVA